MICSFKSSLRYGAVLGRAGRAGVAVATRRRLLNVDKHKTMATTLLLPEESSQQTGKLNSTRKGSIRELSTSSRWGSASSSPDTDRPSWSEEWKRLGLGATLVNEPKFPQNLFFVQLGFGVDQHGDRSNATKAAVRAIRNAIEFNSIPGVIEHIPGGRKEMLIHVKLGVPNRASVDVMEVAKVFPYGRLLPIQVEVGGLDFPTGRVVEELGDKDDIGICVAACVTIGYNDESNESRLSVKGKQEKQDTSYKTFNTKDGY